MHADSLTDPSLTRRAFTHNLSALIVWGVLALEGVYFLFLALSMANASGTADPNAAQPGAAVFIAILLTFLSASYATRRANTRGWLHILAPVFLVYGLFALATAAALNEDVRGFWKTSSVTANALSGFGFMAVGVFSIVARLFMPKNEAMHALPPNAPADRPEP